MGDSLALLRGRIIRLLKQRRFASTNSLFDEYLSSAQDDWEMWILAATVNANLGDAGFAKRRAKHVIDNFFEITAPQLGSLGNALYKSNDIETAEKIFRRAYEISPDKVSTFNLAAVCRSLGKLEEAERLYDSVIVSSPDDAEAIKNRSDLRRQTESANHVVEIQRKIARAQSDDSQMRLKFALGKELEDLGRYEEAFAAYQNANDIRRSRISYEVSADVEIINSLTRSHLSSQSDDETSTPIFVVGLPRTGTTLVERILACHSSIVSIGESVAFPAAMNRAAASNSLASSGSVLQRIDQLKSIKSTVLSTAYLAEVVRRHDVKSSVVTVDKLPLNYLHVGLIRHGFPRAKIVWVKRDALDTVIALYRTLFTAPYPFTYNLEELTTYLVAFYQLEKHWLKSIPELHVVNYESLVTDQETVTRNLVSYCGLDWEDACLHPEKSTQPGTTASAVQVRQSVHSRSVGQWRNYESQLSETIRELRNVGLA